jgi:signal transduction histidine kinase
METKKKILIVDDTIDTVDLLRKRLRAEGYDTAEAYDGEECLKLVDAYSPDLIILDIMMPKLDGYEVCRRLKADECNRYIPVLMLTAKSDVEDKVKGLDTGADDYIPKPFNYKELSARVRSLLAIRQAHEKLAEEEKTGALECMMDEVAHEVRNPLTSIGGFARRVYDNLPEGSPNRKYMEMIIEDVRRIETIIKHLIEMETVSLSYVESTNINDIIREALKPFEQEFEDRAIDVDTALMEDPPPISADQEQLKKAISNLIKNAVEAMTGEARHLKIATGISESRLEVVISDSGKGISKEKLKNIFDPLYTSKIYGPGLGLTFALKIVHAHRGTISVESEPGKGSTFTLRLPLKKG